VSVCVENIEDEIFCREIENRDGTIQDGKARAEDFVGAKAAANVLEKRNRIQEAVIHKCIDVRLFGATIPVSPTRAKEKQSSVTLTGPVQFAMGTSLHRVEPRYILGTGAFASGEGRERRTFREEYVLPYALLVFYGIVNQRAAVTTQLTEEDVRKLYEAMWYGTKNLITRSKIGQRPLLLLVVEYREEASNAYIGRLDRFVRLLKAARGEAGAVIRDEELRDSGDFRLDLSQLRAVLGDNAERILQLKYAWDKRLALTDEPDTTAGTFLGLPARDLRFA